MKIVLFILWLFTLLFIGCKSSATIKQIENNKASYTICVDIGEVAFNTIAKLQGSDTIDASTVFDTPTIQETLQNMGLENVQFEVKNTSDSLFIQLSFDALIESKTYDLLKFSPNKKSLTLTLSPTLFTSILDKLPQDVASYFDLLMAPALDTEDDSLEEDYLQNLAMFYGKDLSKQVQDALFEISFFPKGKQSPSKLNISVIEALCLNDYKRYTLSW